MLILIVTIVLESYFSRYTSLMVWWRCVSRTVESRSLNKRYFIEHCFELITLFAKLACYYWPLSYSARRSDVMNSWWLKINFLKCDVFAPWVKCYFMQCLIVVGEIWCYVFWLKTNKPWYFFFLIILRTFKASLYSSEKHFLFDNCGF